MPPSKKAAAEEEAYEEVRSNWVKFNVVDDYVKGTLMEIFVPQVPDQYGKKNRSYVLKAIEGSFHGNDANRTVDKDPTEIEAGAIWRVGSNERIDSMMAGIKIGQRIMFRLTELRPTKKGNPAKIIKVLKGPMDEEALKEIEAQNAANGDDWDL